MAKQRKQVQKNCSSKSNVDNYIKQGKDGWYFIDEAYRSHGPFSSEEWATLEMKLYCDIELEGKITKYEPKPIGNKKGWQNNLYKAWDWWDGPILGTVEDKVFCMWKLVKGNYSYLYFDIKKSKHAMLKKKLLENGEDACLYLLNNYWPTHYYIEGMK